MVARERVEMREGKRGRGEAGKREFGVNRGTEVDSLVERGRTAVVESCLEGYLA
jgi:hypothetical protein